MADDKADEAEAFLASLPEPVQKRLAEIKQLHEQYTGLEEECQKEIQAVEAKYLALFRPLWSQRKEIVAGDTGGVPGFWLHAMQNHEVLAQLISEKDAAILQHLTDIECTEDDTSFKLHFHFSKNDFFDHSTLEKDYVMASETKDMLQKSEGTKIEWKAGKDPTVKLMRRKPQGKGRGRGGAPTTKLEPVDSFFRFFSPPKIPTGEEIAMDEQDLEELQETLQEDYEVGETLRSDIIPNAYLWFTGEAAQEESEEDEGSEDEEDEDDDDDDDEDEQDEEDDNDDEDTALVDADGIEDITPGRKGGSKSKAGAKAPQDTAEKPQECKQQ